ncbi:MAG: hypothetical protein V4530_05995 [Pseudomonadota bacterium]
MKTFTNYQAGPRGINLKGGGTHWIEPGASVDLDPKTIEGAVPDLGTEADAKSDGTSEKWIAELEAENARLTARVTELEAKVEALDHDGNGKAGGSNPNDRPALAGKNKAELIHIAKDEGVEHADDATNAQIVEAIQAKRDAA